MKLKAGTISYKTEAELQAFVVNYIKRRWPYVRYCASLGGQYQKHISQRKKAKGAQGGQRTKKKTKKTALRKGGNKHNKKRHSGRTAQTKHSGRTATTSNGRPT